MPYVRSTLNKNRPASAGKTIVDTDEWLIVWKFKTKHPPTPKKYANLVMFLKDNTIRKRSYHFSWDGQYLNDCEDMRILMQRQPEMYERLIQTMQAAGKKIVRARPEVA